MFDVIEKIVARAAEFTGKTGYSLYQRARKAIGIG